MKTDFTTRLASLLLIFFFVYNDLHASAYALRNWDHLVQIAEENLDQELNFSTLSSRTNSTLEATPKQIQTKISKPDALPNTLSAQNSFSVSALEATGRIGLELHMPINDPANDIFNFILPEDFNNREWSSVYLRYRLKGLVDGKGLAKSFNSQETFGSRSLEIDDQWKEVTEKVSASDLKAGRNYLRFTIPNGLGLTVELSDVELEFNRLADGVIESPRLERVVTVDSDLFRTLPEMDNASAFRLREVEMPAIPEGLINITSGAKAYQPSAEVAAQAEFIGFKLNLGNNIQRKLGELQIFYFDYDLKSWQGVKIDSIDTQGEIAFVPNKGQTQYFGALIKSPEMPEASAFAPTMIQDIEAANPATGINLMQAPDISRTGEASISYPLELPAGRNGLQPQVALNYNSEGKSSWAGYGWNVRLPSISVDTKWGVPTFDAVVQTEMYTINGEPLFEEGANRSNRNKYNRQSGNVLFFEKTRTSYRKVERIGNDPRTYYWKVTETSGTEYYYGHYTQSFQYTDASGTQTLNAADAKITNFGGDVVKWNLTQVVDVNGNTVVYEYDKGSYASGPSIPSNSPLIDGVYQYPRSIFYTGTESSADLGNYRVLFNRNASLRLDPSIDMRFGAKLVDAELLDKVEVHFKMSGSTQYNSLVKAFRLDYKTLSNAQERVEWQYKSILEALAEERGGSEFYKHDFEYKSGAMTFNSTPEKVEINPYDDRLFDDLVSDLIEFLPGGNVFSKVFFPSPLGTSTTRTHAFEGSVGFGWVLAKVKFSKNMTFSGVVGGTNGSSQVKTKLMDMNADGLPDLLRTQSRGNDASYYYYPMRKDEQGEYYFGSEVDLNNDGLYYTNSSSTKIGFDAVAQFTAFGVGAVISYARNWVWTHSSVDSYLIDYNQDGIMDVVKPHNGGSYVHFGSLDLNTGELTFNPNSNTSLSPILNTGTAPSFNDPEAEPIMGLEIVRAWQAPETGLINITGTASLTPDAIGEVEVAIQKNSNYIPSNGFQSVTSSSSFTPSITNYQVNKGDILMFRIRSGANSYMDQLTWNPQINYTDPGLAARLDGAGNELLNTSANDGFLLSGHEGAMVTANQRAFINWDPFNIPVLSDDIQLRISITGIDVSSTDSNSVYRAVFYKDVAAGTGPTTIQALPSEFTDYSGSGAILNHLGIPNNMPSIPPGLTPEELANIHYYVLFSVVSTSNVNWKLINWRPRIEIGFDACGIEGFKKRFPAVKYRTFNRITKTTPFYDGGFAGATNARLWPTFASSLVTTELTTINRENAHAYLVIKSGNNLVTKARVNFNKSTGSTTVYTTDAPGKAVSLITSATASPGLYSFNPNNINNLNEVYFEWYSPFPELNTLLKQGTLTLYNLGTSSSIATVSNYQVFERNMTYFSDPWLQWGSFAWNDLDRISNNPINLFEMVPATESVGRNNRMEDMENPVSEDFDVLFGASSEPEFKFNMLKAVRGEDSAITRSYTSDAVGDNSVNPALMDRYSAYGSHAGVYGETNLSIPYLLSQPDKRVISNAAPSGNDIARAISLVSTGKTLGYTFSAGISYDKVPELDVDGAYGKDIEGPDYFRQEITRMSDLNGDGFPEIWEGDDIIVHYTDPRGGSLGTVNLGPGPKNNSVVDKQGTLGLGYTLNEDALNLTERAESTGGAPSGVFQTLMKNVGMSASYQVGVNVISKQWQDINGDGLADLITEDANDNVDVLLNSGYGFDIAGPKRFADNHKRTTNVSVSINSTFSQPISNALMLIASDALKEVLSRIETKNKSFTFGLADNRSSTSSNSFLSDVNGDGLPDRIVQDQVLNYNFKVFLNLGNGFATDALQFNGGVPTRLEQNNSASISAGAHGTVAFPVGSPGIGVFKLAIQGGYSYAYGADFKNSSFMDFNGDGAADIVDLANDNSVLVYYNKSNDALRLKRVNNPLGGHFTLEYELEGNKHGYYTSVVKTEQSDPDEDVFWDMPFAKWVLSKVEIHDGVDVLDGANDLDGVDRQIFTYHYDAGVRSRRERDFLGFSRIEKRSEALQFAVTQVKPMQHALFINHPTCWLERSNDPKYALRTYSDVKIFESLDANDFQSRKEFEYKNGVLKASFKFLDYAVYQHYTFNTDDPECQVLNLGQSEISQVDRYRHTLSKDEYRYDFYQVNVNDGTIVFDVQADALKSVNFATFGETGTIFPAVVKSFSYTYPEVDTTMAFYATAQNPVNYLMATENEAEYDVYYNITQYTLGAANAQNTFTRVPVKTTNYNKIEEYPTSVDVRLAPDGSGGFVFEVINPYGTALLIPNARKGYVTFDLQAPAGYDVYRLYLREDLLDETCGITRISNETGVPIPVVFKRTVPKSIIVYEDNLNQVLTAEIIAKMEYHSAPLAHTTRTNLVSSHRVYLGSDANPVERLTNSSIDTKGRITQIDQVLASLATNNTASTNITYNANGLVSRMDYPENNTGQRMYIELNYDSHQDHLVTSVGNAYGESSCNIYSEDGSALLLQTIDINGHPMRTVYDDKYRPIEIYGPLELSASTIEPAIVFEYHPEGLNRSPSNPNTNEWVAYAITRHNINAAHTPNGAYTLPACSTLVDVSSFTGTFSSANTLETATFIDGNGKTVQVKKEAAWDNGTSLDRNFEVSGFSSVNIYGLPVVNRITFLDPASKATSANLATLSVNPSEDISVNRYDYASRVDRVKTKKDFSSPLTPLTTILYEWESTGPLFAVDNTSQNVRVRSLSDALGRTLKEERYRGGGALAEITEYDIDALGQTRRYKSPATTNWVSYDYDEFGRQKQEDHVDRGITNFKYDLASNLLQSTNADLETITNTYNFNRLLSSSHSKTGPVNDLEITYGTKGDGKNGAGKVTRIIQGTSFKTENYKYDVLGNLIFEEKSINIPQAGTQTFLTEFQYDTWGRLVEMTYPDYEKVFYHYCSTGELASVSAQRLNPITPAPVYLLAEEIRYDGFGNMTEYKYGNQARTIKTFDKTTRRLTVAEVKVHDATGTGTPILNKTFDYQLNGNIDKISNTAGAYTLPSGSTIGGAYEIAEVLVANGIQYDGLNQINELNLKYSPTDPTLQTGLTHNLDITMSYDDAGRLERKDMQTPLAAAAEDYQLAYTYSSTKEHQIRSIEHDYPANSALDGLETFEYNDMGSISRRGYTKNSWTNESEVSNYCWTEDQKLRGVMQESFNSSNQLLNNSFHHYVYDQNGERVLKTNIYMAGVSVNSRTSPVLPMDVPTVYVNAYYIANHYREQVLASKHYYMGSQRIATALINRPYRPPGWSEPAPGEGGENPIEILPGYSEETDGVVVDILSTLECLTGTTDLIADMESFNLQSIGEAVEMAICPEDQGEGGGQFPPELCDCEQSLYWATQNGIDCDVHNIIYYYHPDYLGSVEYVTDMRGNPYQFFLNTIWGENLENQFAKTYTAFSSRFRFNGKEWDDETGNFYYGARYYDPKISVWLSVDPESARDPHMTPYHFVYNNPAIFVDPNGLHGYKVDANGNINKIEDEDTGGETYGGDEYDVVFKADTYEPGQSEEDGHRVNDPKILPQLAQDKKDNKGYDVHYAESSNGEQTFELFLFLAENTDVEWTMIGTMNGGSEDFVLGTRSFGSNSFNPKHVGYDEANETFNLHSHPRTPGGSGFSTKNPSGDRRYMGQKTMRLNKRDKKTSPHFIYHIPSQMFHQYTPARSSLGGFRANSLSKLKSNAR